MSLISQNAPMGSNQGAANAGVPFFGGAARRVQAGTDKPKVDSKFWLNIGVVTQVEDAEGNQIDQFVALPWGIALEGQTLLDETASNEAYAFLNQARNDLLAQVLNFARTLKPGQEVILPGDISGFRIQIRHVREKKAVTGENPFKVKLGLAA